MEEAIRAEMAPLDAALRSPPWSCGLFWSLRPALVPPFPADSPVTPKSVPSPRRCARGLMGIGLGQPSADSAVWRGRPLGWGLTRDTDV